MKILLLTLAIMSVYIKAQELAAQMVELYIGTTNVHEDSTLSKSIIIYMQAHSSIWTGQRVGNDEIDFSITNSFKSFKYDITDEYQRNLPEGSWYGFSSCVSADNGAGIFGYGLYK